ncbi:hypothetical protein [Methanobacterium sp. MBAC-LM]|uniref:hypothetical protein n=1 Tax=Methanobacterium sp. MBAC-LM TaxID=3412034 RepID=UPI003C77C612
MIVENRENVSELQFTGNWFIDAGIIGFIQVVEDVYELPKDLNDLITYFSGLSDDNFKILIYYAYMIYNIEKTASKYLNRTQLMKGKKVTSEIEKNFLNAKINLKTVINFRKEDPNVILALSIDEINEKILKYNLKIKFKFKESFDIFNLYPSLIHVEHFSEFNNAFDVFNKEKLLKKTFSSNKKTPNEKLDNIGLIFEEQFFQNLYFLNTSVNKKNSEIKVLDIFHDLIYDLKVKKEDNKIDQKVFDKTISKFMFSAEEFSNIFYGKASNLEDLNNFVTNPHIFMLCFPFPFITVAERGYKKNIFFYTPNLNVCYKINKKLNKKIEYINFRNHSSIFQLTWNTVIDEISELKSFFTLENMYLVEYEGISQQALLNVEYVGIPKLQASIILDDSIRTSLNSNLQIKGDKSSKNTEWVWLLEEFIKNRPLFPFILKHVTLRIKSNTDQKVIKPLLYSLSADAKLKSLIKSNNGKIFEPYFSLELEDIVYQIKENYKWMSLASKNISKVFSSDSRDKFVHRLVTTIKKRNKHAFVNIIIKALLEQSKIDPKHSKTIKYINEYIFSNLVQNEDNWENYALALLVGFL